MKADWGPRPIVYATHCYRWTCPKCGKEHLSNSLMHDGCDCGQHVVLRTHHHGIPYNGNSPTTQRDKVKRERVWKKTDGFCYYCGRQLDHHWTLDHMEPVSRGGKSSIENLVPCCPSCNSKKGQMTLEEFRGKKLLPRRDGKRIFYGENL